MAKKAIRFGVTDNKGNRSSTWICTIAKPPKNDIYLVCRELGGALKISLHESGDWRFAYNQDFFDDNFDEIDKSRNGRSIEKWTRPPEIASGVTLAMRILIPWGSITTAIGQGSEEDIYWVNQPLDGYAIEFDLIITEKDIKSTQWPGKNGMKTQLVGSVELSGGETVWIVFHEILMPVIEQQSYNPKFIKGQNLEIVKSKNLKIIAFDVAEDGSRVLYDFSVQYCYK